jgi:uncharacterized protein DUF3987
MMADSRLDPELQADLDAMMGESSHAALNGGSKPAESPEQPPRVDHPWPAPLDEKALHGVAGKFVRTVRPHTEADDAALLVSFLVAAGNVIGRKVYRIAEAAYHYTNSYAVLVGETSHGRKGSALAQVLRPFRQLDPEWASSHVGGGLSSGEGLIWAVRDAIEHREAVKERGTVTGYQTVETDSGVADKRLLVIEPEFAGVLKVARREGNTLSSVLRKAWDAGDLGTMTKNSPARATDAHISAIAHITRDELLRGLDSTEAANGLFNRFLWICVRRSKLLPHGGKLTDSDLQPLVGELHDVTLWCNVPKQLAFSDDAAQAWTKVYGSLSDGRPGLLGAVLGRAEAQTLRLAVLYAALDCSLTIELDHLRAALAVWQYCEDSAGWIFGDRLGDPDADAILGALRANPTGLSRTQIQELFSRNLSVGRLAAALASLFKGGFATVRRVATRGRPAEIWEARKTGS